MCRTPSTSRRIAAMAGESIRVTRSVSIPRSEIELRFSRSSGPGGQHAQKTETRAEALFEVERSVGLTPTQKRRVVAKVGPVLRAVAQDERSQWRNRELAIEGGRAGGAERGGNPRARERARRGAAPRPPKSRGSAKADEADSRGPRAAA